MGVRFPSAAFSGAGINVGTAAETVVATTPPLNIPLDFAQVLLFWYIMAGGGATIASILFRLRRGTTTGGTLLNTGSQADATLANANFIRSGFYVDTPGAVAEQQYVLTLTCAGNSGTEQVVDCALVAFCL